MWLLSCKKYDQIIGFMVNFLSFCGVGNSLQPFQKFLGDGDRGFGREGHELGGLLVGLLFIALGNQLPRQMQNHVFGIRTKLTLSDEDVWRASHRFGGWVMTLGGVVVILAALLQWWWMALVVFVVVFAATLIYPRWYYNQREKK